MMNLFVVEACTHKKDNKGRPTINKMLANKIMTLQENLVFKVLGILKPKLIISLTGHSLDNILFNNCLGTSKVQVKSIDVEEIINKDKRNKCDKLMASIYLHLITERM